MRKPALDFFSARIRAMSKEPKMAAEYHKAVTAERQSSKTGRPNVRML
jgi:hypothetical protein